jgi:hypothetical protein
MLNLNNGLSGNPTGNAALTRLSKIPELDAWGNSLQGTAYTTASSISGNGSATTIYRNATVLDLTKVTIPYHWALAMWNSVDNAARNVRLDVNKPNRVGDTTVNNLAIQFFVIGYPGNGGVDDGLLMRVANDTNATGYVSAQPQGRYYVASDPVQLADALNKVASQLLRLAR